MTAAEQVHQDVVVGEWHETLAGLRDGGFDYFDWLTAVDQTDAEEDAGFDVVCHLMATAAGTGRPPATLRRVLVRTRVPEGTSLASLTDLWRGAAWHERETHEMFGIEFTGFADGLGDTLRPLLLPDGFEGTPLRKSFVLAARASKAWPGEKEPGGGTARGKRRKLQPPGVPDESWGPR
ncbi:NADH-quinone oxidoreductase subunit C [Segeticoccus rhizosphaerae]|uniref:NADH-quinone oxidoreductase subunit C n=1 Tax=Segeticoccus rhizosphaerae TaxID=1104777 RepID=UPI0010BF8D1A|nr:MULTISPECIES: NADH-quinone oxidoreductase subunit C [Intrasporangiaceae]